MNRRAYLVHWPDETTPERIETRDGFVMFAEGKCRLFNTEPIETVRELLTPQGARLVRIDEASPGSKPREVWA